MSVISHLRGAAEHTMCITGLTRFGAPIFGGLGAILALHRVRPANTRGPVRLAVTPEFLEGTITLMRKRGYCFVSMTEALARMRDGKSRKRFACLTFDDGYADNWEYRAPALSCVDCGGS